MNFEKLKTKSLENFKNEKLDGLKNIKGGVIEATYYGGVQKDQTDDETCDTYNGDFYWCDALAPDGGGTTTSNEAQLQRG